MSSSPEIEERDLVDGFLRGDPGAHKTIDAWIDTVLREGFRSLRVDWEDLKQEVRARLYRNLNDARFEGRSGLRTYVHSIARNVCIDSSRLAYRRRQTGEATELPDRAERRNDAPMLNLIHKDLLVKILRDVSDQDRLLIRLVLLERYSYAEVATLLGVSQAAVKGRVARCKMCLLEAHDRLIRMRGEVK